MGLLSFLSGCWFCNTGVTFCPSVVTKLQGFWCFYDVGYVLAVGLTVVAGSAFFIRRSGVLASLFSRKVSGLRLFGPNSSPVCSRHLLALLPRSCQHGIAIRSRCCLGRRCSLTKVRVSSPLTPIPSNCGNGCDHAYASLLGLGRVGGGSGCIFLGGVFSYVRFGSRGSSFSARRLRVTTGTNLVSGGMCTLKNVDLRGLGVTGSLKFKNIMVYKSV